MSGDMFGGDRPRQLGRRQSPAHSRPSPRHLKAGPFCLTFGGVRAYLTVRQQTFGAGMKVANQARMARIPPKTLYCSFCIRSQHEVRKLIFGPAGVFICDECVGLCNDVIAGRPPNPSKFPSADELSTRRLLEYLRSIDDAMQGKRDQLQSTVELLRSREVSWAKIGAALDVCRQSAWERFS